MSSYTGSIRRDGNHAKRKFTEVSGSVTNGAEYCKAILAPFSSSGAKVPDLAAYPTNTSTFQLEYTQVALQTTSTSSSTYCAGGALVLSSGFACYCPEVTGVGAPATVINGTNDDTFVYVAPGGGTNPINVYKHVNPTGAGISASNNGFSTGSSGLENNAIPGVESLYTTYSASRLVGAGLRVEFIGNDQNNQGLITCCQVTSLDCVQERINNNNQGISKTPFSNWGNNVSGVTTFSGTTQFLSPIYGQSALENFRNNYSGAAKDGCFVGYSPLDDEDILMGNMVSPEAVSVGGTAAGTPSGAYNVAGVNWARTSGYGNFGTENTGVLHWHAQGIASGAQFRVYIILHYEGIPRTDNIGYEKPCSAPSDPVAQSVVNTLAELTQGGKNDEKVQSNIGELAMVLYNRGSEMTAGALAGTLGYIAGNHRQIAAEVMAGEPIEPILRGTGLIMPYIREIARASVRRRGVYRSNALMSR